ncbi:MAG: DUF393 domain-containing protein [Acidobacteria bacterium]|nr:DUF393 domain-containing protein [Acidobacteriota bacterium]
MLHVFYDGRCYVCAAEIQTYRKRARAGSILFVDISDPAFVAAEWDRDYDSLQRIFHVRLADGTWRTGVSGFIEIWKSVPGWSWLANLAEIRPVRWALDLGYLVFAWLRPYLPKKGCEDGTCTLRT